MEDNEYEKEQYAYAGSSPHTPITIKITNPIIKDDRFSKHVTYTIIGEDNKGPFEAQRRYKEFNSIQHLLNTQWPGCYIPQIPGKKAIGNLEENFIEKRKKLLEIFLIKLSAIPFLYHSDEFQTFIRGPTDFMKISKDFKQDSYLQIAEKFSHNFNDCIEQQEPDDIEAILEDSLKFFKMTLENIEKFEVACKETVLSFEGYAKKTSGMLYGVRDLNKFFADKYNGKNIDLVIREECINPYQVLLEWAYSEALDLKGIIQAIARKQELAKIRIKANEKFEEEKKNLLSAQNGKKNWKSILSKQTKEQKISKVENLITEAQKELDTIKLIEHILNIRLGLLEVPRLKQEKTAKYEKILKAFVGISIEEFESLIQQAKQIDFVYTFTN